MPYFSPLNASSISLVKYRNRGSGLTLNGLSFRPKKLLYMVSESRSRAELKAAPEISFPYTNASGDSARTCPMLLSSDLLDDERLRVPLEADRKLMLQVTDASAGRATGKRIFDECCVCERSRRSASQRPLNARAGEPRVHFRLIERADETTQAAVTRIPEVEICVPNTIQVARRRTRNLIGRRAGESPAARCHTVVVPDRKVGMRNGIRQVAAAGNRNALCLVIQRNLELRDFRPDEKLKRSATRNFATVRKLRDVIADSLRIADVAVAGKAIQDSECVALGQLIIVADAADLIVARDVSRFLEPQDAVGSGKRDRRTRAQICRKLGRRRIRIARTERVEDALVRHVVRLQGRKRWPQGSADSRERQRARHAESELSLRQIVKLVDDREFRVAPLKHLLRLHLVVVTVALLGVGGERTATRVVHRKLSAAPLLKDADVTSDEARGVPVSDLRRFERGRSEEVSVLDARHDVTVAFKLSAEAGDLHAGQ